MYTVESKAAGNEYFRAHGAEVSYEIGSLKDKIVMQIKIMTYLSLLHAV